MDDDKKTKMRAQKNLDFNLFVFLKKN